MMRRLQGGILVVVVALLMAVPVSASFPRTVVDGLGNEIYLEAPPERIFSVALAIDNILLSFVDSQRVVGVSLFATRPELGSYVADVVQDHMALVEALNAEQVLAARPDIVLVTSWNDPDAVEQMRRLGVRLYTFTGFETVADALDNIRRVGEIVGEEDKAEAVIEQFYSRYGQIAMKIAGLERPRVLAWDDWGTTYGPGMSIHDIIEMAGGRNVAAEHGITGWATIDAETVLQMNPDVLVTPTGEALVDQFLSDPVLQAVSAVRTGRVYYIEHMEALNEHFILAIEQLAKTLHPEAFD